MGTQTVQVGIFEHVAYSPDLVPSDYHVFFHLKKFLVGQSARHDQETTDIVEDWLKGLAVTFFDEGIQKLVPRCDVPLFTWRMCGEVV